jgi:hypothetical protein
MDKTPKSVGSILEGIPIAKAAQSRIRQRQIDAAVLMGAPDDSPLSVLYQHSTLCQVYLPYRDPGDETRVWERTNGDARLKIMAGDATDERGAFVPLGLPFGPRARVVLMQINQRAILSQSPLIEIEDSLTRFIGKALKLGTDGKTIRVVKSQLARLAAATIRLGLVQEGRSITVNSQIVTAFDIWFPKTGGQRPLWPSTLQLSHEYWTTLQPHAVPLNEVAIGALSHSALALDAYAWLAQRLHRVPKERPAFVPWTALHAQFGHNYSRLRKFREVFGVALKQVAAEYPKARMSLDDRGMLLRHSAPPVPYRPGPIVRIVDKPVKP